MLEQSIAQNQGQQKEHKTVVQAQPRQRTESPADQVPLEPWETVGRLLKAEKKKQLRQSLMNAPGDRTDSITITQDEKTWNVRREPVPKNPEEYYAAITPHMTDSLYWIRYESYATGDLTSLAAAVINDPYHGISMCFNSIGESDPLTNMKLLQQFLGGILDPDNVQEKKPVIFVITDEGAKGRWFMGSQASKVEYDKLREKPDDESEAPAVAVDLQSAAFHLQTAGKYWEYILWYTAQEQLKQKGEEIIRETARAAQRCMKILIDNDAGAGEGPGLESILQKESDWIAAALGKKAGQPFIVTHNLPVPDRNEMRLARDNAENLAVYTGAIRDFAKEILDCVSPSADTQTAPAEGSATTQHEISLPFKLPEDKSQYHHAQALKFSQGTNIVATYFGRQQRERLRRAWKIDSPDGSESYDENVKKWLETKGIPSEKLGDVVLFWIRKSGERGGAHYENDTSFRNLTEKVEEDLNAGKTVFLVGDNKDGKVQKLIEKVGKGKKCYNLTEFWKSGPQGAEKAAPKPDTPSQADTGGTLASWGGHTRVGQFRLYDYLKRNARTLEHKGVMSGNLEAMALLGHRVHVYAASPDSPGVPRMSAYRWHDSAVEGDDKIGYDFEFLGKQNGTQWEPQYEKKAAVHYLWLKDHLEEIMAGAEPYNVRTIALPGDFCKPSGEGQPKDIPAPFKAMVQEYAENVVWPPDDSKETLQRVMRAVTRGEVIKVPDGQAEKVPGEKEPKEQPKDTRAEGEIERKRQQGIERKLAQDRERQRVRACQDYAAYLRIKAYEQWFMERTRKLSDHGSTQNPLDPIQTRKNKRNGQRTMDKKTEQFWDYLLIRAAKVWKKTAKPKEPTPGTRSERKEDPASA